MGWVWFESLILGVWTKCENEWKERVVGSVLKKKKEKNQSLGTSEKRSLKRVKKKEKWAQECIETKNTIKKWEKIKVRGKSQRKREIKLRKEWEVPSRQRKETKSSSGKRVF